MTCLAIHKAEQENVNCTWRLHQQRWNWPGPKIMKECLNLISLNSINFTLEFFVNHKWINSSQLRNDGEILKLLGLRLFHDLGVWTLFAELEELLSRQEYILKRKETKD